MQEQCYRAVITPIDRVPYDIVADAWHEALGQDEVVKSPVKSNKEKKRIKGTFNTYENTKGEGDLRKTLRFLATRERGGGEEPLRKDRAFKSK